MALCGEDKIAGDDFQFNFEGFDIPDIDLDGKKSAPTSPREKETGLLNLPNANQSKCYFDQKMLQRLLNHFKPKIKVHKNPNILLSELMRIYTVEIITRAGELAVKEGATKISQEHLEKILPQFLLDFN